MNEIKNHSASIVDKQVIHEGRFLVFEEITYRNDDGRTVKWEAVQRKGGARAVSITAIKRPSNKIVLVRQFRAPIGKYCIENPAGIVDSGESIKDAAKRELLEETGYSADEIYENGIPTESSAGMTGELVFPVIAYVNEKKGININPVQSLDATECIEVLEVPINDLEEFLKERDAIGDCISGRIMHMVIGIKIAETMNFFKGRESKK